ncbi:hypothetical protein BDV36DRAFT_271620 [Aspergillus pseudocaelatus]|uniref:Amino acid permease/ SLC12A domain-containing protein n=1 Tax=Aspergillus pseudocaelatus TaxID=1825620 RepID=A0ABQ6W5N9_9EURO|nr:hypothetical protein BDV36DRAFT_271620 [Aspergillus pseudocaelatus]
MSLEERMARNECRSQVIRRPNAGLRLDRWLAAGKWIGMFISSGNTMVMIMATLRMFWNISSVVLSVTSETSLTMSAYQTV